MKTVYVIIFVNEKISDDGRDWAHDFGGDTVCAMTVSSPWHQGYTLVAARCVTNVQDIE